MSLICSNPTICHHLRQWCKHWFIKHGMSYWWPNVSCRKLAIVSSKNDGRSLATCWWAKHNPGFLVVQNSMKSALGPTQVCLPGEQTTLLIQNCSFPRPEKQAIEKSVFYRNCICSEQRQIYNVELYLRMISYITSYIVLYVTKTKSSY